jgi:hypothetical protein
MSLPIYISKHRLAQLLRTDIRRQKVTSRQHIALLEVGDGKFLPLYDRSKIAKKVK